jgi:hypothetical protein
METYLYFAQNEGADAAGDACVFPASNFRGINPVNATTTDISFKSLSGTAVDDLVRVTHVTGKFKSLCEALADALSDDNKELVIFMDEDNAVYSKKLRDLGCIDSSTAVQITLA